MATYTGTCGTNVTWSLDDNTGALNIEGAGEMTNYSSNSAVPWYNYLSYITTVNISSGVTTIGNRVFRSATNLISIVIPDTVTSIGSYAFYGCTSLTSITINDNITSIGSSTFYNCKSLTAVYITNLESWCNIAFVGTSSNPLYYAHSLYLNGELVTELNIPNTITSIKNNAFCGCTSFINVSMPNTVTSIGLYAFNNCTSITHVTIGNGMTSIGGSAFSGCSSLIQINIPNGITSIEGSVFSNCASLSSITIPDGVTSIGSSSFYGCASLRSITIPRTVTRISERAFANCTSMTSIDVSIENTNYCSIDGVLYNKNQTMLICYPACKEVAYFTIQPSVSSVSPNAFQGCVNLLFIDFAQNTTILEIGSYAFYGCNSVVNIKLPTSVTYLGDYSFANCTNLINIIIPQSVMLIEEYAFYNCNSLTNAYYGGNEERWAAIDIGDRNTSLTSSTIVYNFDADNYICDVCGDKLIWILNITTGILSILGTGDMYIYSMSGTPWYLYSSDIINVEINDGATSISQYAFANLPSLTGVKIPSSITSIGNYAFMYSTSIESIDISEENSYYISSNGVLFTKDMSQLIFYPASKQNNYYTIPSEVTNIVGYAFYGCKYLKNILFYDDCEITNISQLAFGLCPSLEVVTIPSSITKIEMMAFYQCTSLNTVIIGDNVTEIGVSAFNGCNNLDSIFIPSNVVSIGNSAFENCSKLHTVKFDINSKLQSVGNSAFGHCESIESISLPNSLATLGYRAFWYCSALSSIEIPSKLAIIDEQVFRYCTSLTSVIIPSNITSIGTYAFNGCTSLSFVTVSSGVSTINKYAFQDCSALKEVMLPSTMTLVNSSAFYNCGSISDVYYNGSESQWNSISILTYNDDLLNANIHYNTDFFGSGLMWSFNESSAILSILGVGTMEDYKSYTNVPWFNYVSNISEVNIASGVKNIGDRAFMCCTNLSNIVFDNNSTLESIGKYAFNKCSIISIDIPAGVHYISETAFYDCHTLTTITVNPENEHYSSYDGVLYADDNKTLVHYPSGKSSIFAISNSVEKIGNYAFATNQNLTAIIIPDSITSIGCAAFKDCIGLTAITIPASIRTIGIIAFTGCTALTTITFSNDSTVTSIGHGAFSYCTALTSVNLGVCGHLEELRYYTFRGCSSLNYNNISLPSGIKVGYQVFYGCINAT